jgi:hypothetical protein
LVFKADSANLSADGEQKTAMAQEKPVLQAGVWSQRTFFSCFRPNSFASKHKFQERPASYEHLHKPVNVNEGYPENVFRFYRFFRLS